MDEIREYYIVDCQRPDGDFEASVVPAKWVIGGKLHCPADAKKEASASRAFEDVDPSWPEPIPCIVVKSFDSFDAARLVLADASDTDGLQSEKELGRGARRKRVSVRLHSLDDVEPKSNKPVTKQKSSKGSRQNEKHPLPPPPISKYPKAGCSSGCSSDGLPLLSTKIAAFTEFNGEPSSASVEIRESVEPHSSKVSLSPTPRTTSIGHTSSDESDGSPQRPVKKSSRESLTLNRNTIRSPSPSFECGTRTGSKGKSSLGTTMHIFNPLKRGSSGTLTGMSTGKRAKEQCVEKGSSVNSAKDQNVQKRNPENSAGHPSRRSSTLTPSSSDSFGPAEGSGDEARQSARRNLMPVQSRDPSDQYRALMKKQQLILTKQLEMDHKLDLILGYVGAGDSVPKPDGWPKNFPLLRKLDLYEFEEILHESETYDFAVNHFSVVVGKGADPAGMAIDLCAKLFTKELAKNLNWQGSENKKGIKKMKVGRMLLDSVAKRYEGNFKKSTVTTAISVWLRNRSS